MFSNALVSVADKTGLKEFLAPMVQHGLRIVSTGGTAKYLRSHGFHVVDVGEQTGFDEVMDGRVKTLHPKIHMALLARSWVEQDMQTLSEHQVQPFDLVIGNLYPFEKTIIDKASEREQIENIDIGGPSFLRAAAKNYERITVLCQPSDYEWVAEKSQSLTLADRKALASRVFAHTAAYDAMLANSLGGENSGGKKMTSPVALPIDYAIGGALVQQLRYGENPHQQASWFRVKGVENGLHQAKVLQGKELSYNNILDLHSALMLIRQFDQAAAVAVKHNNPCGLAEDEHILTAVSKCLKADPVSVFGGVVAVNRQLDKAAADEITKLFIECIIAPGYSQEALDILKNKTNLRVLAWPQMMGVCDFSEFRSVLGGFLMQSVDSTEDSFVDWKIIGEHPDDKIKTDLILAWKVCASLKSNAIALVANKQTLGLGMGQVNRIEAVEHAIHRMKTHHAAAVNVVMASDAFFPFADSVEVAAKAGIRWIIQPGGSKNDDEVFRRAKALGINMVITGTRHFRH